MVSPKILKKHGCTPDAWRLLFAADAGDKLREIKKLELIIQNRINDGRLKNMMEYRPYAAIDLAYDVPFSQTTPTIVQSLLGRPWEKTEDMLSAMKQWGLNIDELFLKQELSPGITGYRANPPTFYKIFIPLLKAYVTIRWAKLYNERNQNPLLKYEPLEPNEQTRILCEILTGMVQVVSNAYGYSSVLRDVIFQTLTYSICLAFPSEVWHTEYQSEEVNGEEEKVLQKEGIRYSLPHPTRMFWDLFHPITSFNTDTGCEYAGYWKIVTYGTILDNAQYWNRRSIGYSSQNWLDPLYSSNFFSEVYPCQLKFPIPASIGSDTNRENQASFYTTNQRDKAVFQTDFFMKLVPKKFKLGTYPHPIWVRFVVAGDSTVIYAEPCCYSPILVSTYDSNNIRSKNSGLGLEVLPFQDMVGNVMSQILLTTKQNLANVIFYDTNAVSREQIDLLKNGGELMYRSMNFIGFDSRKTNVAGITVEKAFHEVKFAYKDVQPLFQGLNTTLAILERLIQISSQEAGAAASHQQSAKEIATLDSATSNRVRFTGSFIDDFMDAWKQQQVDAARAYADDDIVAMVPGDIPDLEMHLKELGFEIDSKLRSLDGRVRVKGSKKNLSNLDLLLKKGAGFDRTGDTQTAQVMMQTVGAIAANQPLAEALGTRTILKLFQQAAVLAGADKDLNLQPDKRKELDALSQMAQQIQIAAAKHAEETIGKPAAEQVAKLQQEIQVLDQAMSRVIQQLTNATQGAIPTGAPGVTGQAPQVAGQP